MSKSEFTTKKEANAAGWYSRRNKTNAAQVMERDCWKQRQQAKKKKV